jgi:hypothetical protein
VGTIGTEADGCESLFVTAAESGCAQAYEHPRIVGFGVVGTIGTDAGGCESMSVTAAESGCAQAYEHPRIVGFDVTGTTGTDGAGCVSYASGRAVSGCAQGYEAPGGAPAADEIATNAAAAVGTSTRRTLRDRMVPPFGVSLVRAGRGPISRNPQNHASG